MRAFFLGRHLREKILLVVFVVLGAAIWASSVSTRGEVAWRDFQRTSSDLQEQSMWLSRREEIESAAAAAVAGLDSSRTFNDVQLSAELNAIANTAGLGGNTVSDSPRTEQTPQFQVHTLQVRVNRAEWPALERFYQAISERAPYINIEQFSISADREGRQLNATIRVSSVEIAR